MIHRNSIDTSMEAALRAFFIYLVKLDKKFSICRMLLK